MRKRVKPLRKHYKLRTLVSDAKKVTFLSCLHCTGHSGTVSPLHIFFREISVHRSKRVFFLKLAETRYYTVRCFLFPFICSNRDGGTLLLFGGLTRNLTSRGKAAKALLLVSVSAPSIVPVIRKTLYRKRWPFEFSIYVIKPFFNLGTIVFFSSGLRRLEVVP